MANRQKKDHRSSDLSRRQGIREIKQSFLIVCEGEKTEPDYFKAFRMTAATVKAVGQAMNTMTLVSKAISIRESDKKRKKVYDQCWVVFDKDDFPAKDFNQAIQFAEKNGFRVAYSNQAFEYWFLLHYNLYTGAIHRNQYKDMLTKLTGMPYRKSEGYVLSCTICFSFVNSKPSIMQSLYLQKSHTATLPRKNLLQPFRDLFQNSINTCSKTIVIRVVFPNPKRKLVDLRKFCILTSFLSVLQKLTPKHYCVS